MLGGRSCTRDSLMEGFWCWIAPCPWQWVSPGGNSDVTVGLPLQWMDEELLQQQEATHLMPTMLLGNTSTTLHPLIHPRARDTLARLNAEVHYCHVRDVSFRVRGQALIPATWIC